MTIVPNDSAILDVKSVDPSSHTIIWSATFFNCTIILAMFFSSLYAGRPTVIFIRFIPEFTVIMLTYKIY